MSMRYADISSPTNISAPAVPSIPLGLRPGGVITREPDSYLEEDPRARGRREEEMKEEQRKADLKMLDQDRFDPDACKS